MNRLFRIFLVAVATFTPLLVAPSVLAASATFSLSPSGTSVSKGSVVTLSIYENSNGPVNAAKAVLSYPADKLDFVSIGSSSAFAVVAGNSGGGGTVVVDRGALPAVNGRQLVATVRFRAKVDTGTAAVNFTPASIVGQESTNILAGSTGANLTLKPAPVATPAAPPPPADKIPPTVKDIKVVDVSYNAATVTWTSSEPSTSQVDYGLNNGYGLTAGENSPKTDHKLVLNSALLTPGTTYHYVVKSVDPAGNAVAGSDQTFTTKGAVLSVTVLDQNKKPVKGAKIELGNGSGVTDKAGKATVNGLQLGKTVGKITHKGKEQVITVTVNPIDPKGAPQAVTLTFKKSGSSLLFVILPLMALLLLALLLKRKNGWNDLAKYLPNMKPGAAGKDPEPKANVNATPAASTRVEPGIVNPTIPPRTQK